MPKGRIPAPVTTLEEAMRLAVPPETAIENWLATRLYAELAPPQSTHTAQHGTDGRFVLMHSGPIDMVNLARVAAKAVAAAQKAEKRRRENPGDGALV
jgi:hypothetical protein